jgi:hypothetical protein
VLHDVFVRRFTDQVSMLSLRIFGADITKPHTATVRTKPAEAGDNIGTNAAPATASDSKPTVDEEAAQNA